ncbi:MAG: nitroreductase family protein [Candidatus Bathyarchaeia archaeon]
MNVLAKEQSATSLYERILTKIESREFSPKTVPTELQLKVLEAARQTGSGINAQHWRFILVRDKENLERLAADSTTGKWVAKANFAVIVLTDPKYDFHMIDAGRAIQSMMLAAWAFGVASGIYTGVDLKAMARDFGIPSSMNLTAVVGFGYPAKPIKGRKSRRPLAELAFLERFGEKLDL